MRKIKTERKTEAIPVLSEMKKIVSAHFKMTQIA
jgi:hypothetical protein